MIYATGGGGELYILYTPLVGVVSCMYNINP